MRRVAKHRQLVIDFESCCVIGNTRSAFDLWLDIANSLDPAFGTSIAADILSMNRITFIRLIRNGKGPVSSKAFGTFGSTIIRLRNLLEWVRHTGRESRVVGPSAVGLEAMSSEVNARAMVYFVGNGEGCVKIGFTRRPLNERMAQLKTGNPQRLECLAVIDSGSDMRRIERDAHKFFSSARFNGEWFRISSDSAIAYAIAHGGRKWV